MAKLALGEKKNSVKDGQRLLSLISPFNPVTLSLRQTACYRSFHYVFKQQIALQVRLHGTCKKEKLPCPAVLQPACARIITPLSDVQISESSWGRKKTEK